MNSAEWQPIATAPHDRPILIWEPNRSRTSYMPSDDPRYSIGYWRGEPDVSYGNPLG